MNKHKHAELIHKWADGAEIEYYDKDKEKWRPVDLPSWNPQKAYRIRPDTDVEQTGKLKSCGYGVIDKNGVMNHCVYTSIAMARDIAPQYDYEDAESAPHRVVELFYRDLS